MAKLSKENLQFIDNYLDNSNIIYADIRMEMTDHVASEIETRMRENNEANFYTVFKSYMVENKANLLLQNKKFINVVVKQNTKLFFNELIAIKTVILFVSILLFSHYKLFNLILNKSLLFAIPLFSMVPIALIYFIGSKKYKYSRFSGVERLGFMFTVIFQSIHLISILIKPKIKEGSDNLLVSIAFSICIILIYVFVKITFKTIKKYLFKYKQIV